MKSTPMHLALWSVLGVLLVLASGCASSEEARKAREERRQREAERVRAETFVELSMAAPDTSVRSVQLYRGTAENALPIYSSSSGRLTLEFDVLGTTGRPLSVYFYHANRQWRRDLSPGEYLRGFQRDDVLNYTISRGTDVPYVHYTYRVPSDNIQFEVSGNYIIRVTEQGDEDQVLFEQPFYVSEEATSVDFVLDNVFVAGQSSSSIQPIVLFRPPPDLQGNVFDYTTCFVRNNRIEIARCSDRAVLSQQPLLEFFLQPELAFEPMETDYFADIGNLQVGPRISRVDRSTSPFRVVLEPDVARFGSSDLAPLFYGQPINGQTIIEGAVRDVAEPDVAAEYVSTRFTFVPPDEMPFNTEIILTGSFNNWRIDPAYTMEWVSEEGHYVVDVLLKQGAYEYRYFARGERAQRALSTNLPRLNNLYTAFVYYRDPLLNTDRLLAIEQLMSQ